MYAFGFYAASGKSLATNSKNCFKLNLEIMYTAGLKRYININIICINKLNMAKQ